MRGNGGNGAQATDRRRVIRHSPRVTRNLRRGPKTAPMFRMPAERADGVDGVAAAAPPPGGPAVREPGTLAEWHDMTPGEQLAAWAALRAWVTWLCDRYELTAEDRLPACWARHPGLVEELWALRAWRTEIYSGTQPAAGQAARYWHAELERVLHAAATRYAAGCRAGHRGAPHLVAGDQPLQGTWACSNHLAGTPAVDIAAGRAQRTGGWTSPESMADAFDRGEAATVPGLRDHIYRDGAWWVPASGGWVQIPDLGPPPGMHKIIPGQRSDAIGGTEPWQS